MNFNYFIYKNTLMLEFPLHSLRLSKLNRRILLFISSDNSTQIKSTLITIWN